MTTLILNPRGKDGGRPPARVAGRGEAKTRKLGRLPGEKPGTDVRKIRAEAEVVRLLERSLGTHFYFPHSLIPHLFILPALLVDFLWINQDALFVFECRASGIAPKPRQCVLTNVYAGREHHTTQALRATWYFAIH